MVLMAGDGLYESRLVAGQWTQRARLPTDINANGSEMGPLLSPSGRSLLFSRDTKGERSGELCVWRVGDETFWPPRCSASE
jgi:WD40-like Beta Propeller Repeat